MRSLTAILIFISTYSFSQAKYNGGNDDGYTSLTVSSITLSSKKINQEVGKFNIFPNPVKNTLFIQTDVSFHITDIKIYDVLGNEVLDQKLVPNKNINISKLASGLYFIMIGNHSKKFIKK